jgi:hypothetical protein
MMYKLVLLSDPDCGWPDEVAALVSSTMQTILQRDDLLDVQKSVPDENDPTLAPVVVVYLGSELAAENQLIVAELQKAEQQAFSILPIVRSEDNISEVMPDNLRRLNAITWDSMKAEVAMRILEMFGIIEKKRRLFLSYKRDETNLLALQLCRALSERRFDVFLDRFSVPPGDDFPRRIDIELADKSFVLLLESRSALDSPWVQHEVSYALAHHISVLALTMPDVPSGNLFGVIDEAFRYRLRQENFQGRSGELNENALNVILDEIELRCARQLRRRRTQLLGSLSDWLFQAGFRFHAVDDWAILADKEGESQSVLMVTPRGPTPADLREVDLLRYRIPSANPDKIRGYVVHSTPNQDPDNQALVEWILSGRPLATKGLDELPILWGL